MCGIVGVLRREHGAPPTPIDVAGMLGMVRHRGPEAAAVYVDDAVGLGHARLSIIDLDGGLQPLTNEDQSLRLICNGEIFNYVELRRDLIARGHRFRTGSDCETILHLYEERDTDAVSALNGDFAFALWDRPHRRLLLARDRVGVRPLYYTQAGGAFLFGSEIKALLAHPTTPRSLDLAALDQVLTTWSPVPPRTMFEGVRSLLPGHLLVVTAEDVRLTKYWRLEFPPAGARTPVSDDTAADQLRDLLEDATRLRLRADVPVGAYVSGGLDSSVVAALARRTASTRLQTFAVAFADDEYDERVYQERVARLLGSDHHTIVCRGEDTARVLPDVVWHAETPLLRTAPAPLYLLAELVRAHGLKVVLTGEGSDEFLVGYDIFKETKVRAFWARRPESRLRPLLLQRLYGHIPAMASPSQPYRQAFFGAGLERADGRDFSHMLRWGNGGYLRRFLSAEAQEAASRASATDLEALLDGQADDWHAVSRAQYNEVTTFLDPYLLSSQGDRVAMAHAVEGRFPFLDHRVIEYSNSLPPEMKLRGLQEKFLLKRAVADLLPAEIINRPKQPFRAPIQEAFAGPRAPAYVVELLDPARVAAEGIFNPKAAGWLLARARGPTRLSELENMALVGMITFGLFRRAFWDELPARAWANLNHVTVVADYRQGATAAPVAALA